MSDHEKQVEDFGKNDDFWLFGYGSLIWKPPPHYDQRVPGYIEGYVRRFWQASEDHRGTPSAPGRVVTLIDRAHWATLPDHHEPPERVWGAAYHIPTAHVPEVRDYLDIREINGYSIQFTPFHPSASSSQPITCLVYIGLPENPQFLGPQDPQALAEHILRSRGPSGENKEYLYLLEEGLEGLGEGSGDAHVSDLVRRARGVEEAGVTEDAPKRKATRPKGPVDVEKQCGVPLPNGGFCARSLACKSHSMGAKRAVPGRSAPYDMLLEALHKVGNTEEVEEVEK